MHMLVGMGKPVSSTTNGNGETEREWCVLYPYVLLFSTVLWVDDRNKPQAHEVEEAEYVLDMHISVDTYTQSCCTKEKIILPTKQVLTCTRFTKREVHAMSVEAYSGEMCVNCSYSHSFSGCRRVAHINKFISLFTSTWD